MPAHQFHPAYRVGVLAVLPQEIINTYLTLPWLSLVTYPTGDHRGHGPFLSALRGPLRPRNIFTKQWIKRSLGRKMCFSFIHVPLVTRGAPDEPMGPCSHPRAPGFLGPWSPRGPPGSLGAPSRACGPLLGEILGTCLA